MNNNDNIRHINFGSHDNDNKEGALDRPKISGDGGNGGCVEKRLDRLENRLDRVEDRLDQNSSKISELTANIAVLTKEVSTLSENLKKEIGTLSANVTKQIADIAAATKKIPDIEARLSQLPTTWQIAGIIVSIMCGAFAIMGFTFTLMKMV